MKNIGKWLMGKKKYKYINGGKGMISIFLAALMLPFLSLASYLVEAGRYHEAVSILDEAMDSSALSTLSHYDSYLRERFGLLAIRQQGNTNVANTYNSYLNKNLDSVAAWDTLSTTVTPGYSLGDTDVLMQQITEFSKYSVPTALIGELGISELISKLEDATNLTSIFSLLSGAGKVTNSTIEFTKSVETLKESAKQVETNIGSYRSGYVAFKDAVTKLTEALTKKKEAQEKVDNINSEIKEYNTKETELNEQKAELEDDLADGTITQEEYDAAITEIDDEIGLIDTELTRLNEELETANSALAITNSNVNSNVNSSRTNYINAKSTYSQAIQKISDSLEDYKNSANDVIEKKKSLGSDMMGVASDAISVAGDLDKKKENLNSEVEKLEKNKDKEGITEDEKAQIDLQIENKKEQISAIKANYDTTSGAYDAMQEGTDDLSGKVTSAMEDYNEDTITACVNDLNQCKTNVDNLNVDTIQGDFTLNSETYYVSIPATISSASVASLLLQLENKVKGGGFMDMLSAIGEIFKSLCKTNLIYDSSLSAYISEDATYQPSDIDLILAAISELMGYFNTDGNLISGLINILTHIRDIIASLVKLVGAIINYLAGVTARVLASVQELISGECGEKFLLDEYLLKILKNRTTGGGEVPLTGYPYSNIKFASCSEADELPIIGVFTSMVELLNKMSKGSPDKMFCGAELEYILVGSRSEIINQTFVFFDIYFVRLLFDVIPIVSNKEVQAMAEVAGSASFGVGAVVVYVLEIIIEPLIDTILIVNGEDISLLKKVIYLTPSGVPTLVNRVISLGLSTADQDKIIAKASTAFKTNAYEEYRGLSDASSICWDYENYLFVFMLLFGENQEFLRRFQNLISLEANAYYGDGKFKIADTYTYVEISTSGKYNLILPMDKMADTSVFAITRKRARGY